MEIRVYNITKHAKERYAERIMSKNDKLEMNRFIAENSAKIEADINKMVNYGTMVYKGKNPRKDRFGSTKTVEIFVSNSWIVITNPDTKDIITLFKIDLGLGDDEFNKQYVRKLINRIKEQQEDIESVRQAVLEENTQLKEKIDVQTEKINTYRNYIKQLESANSACKDIMDANLIKVSEAEDILDELLEKLVTKK